tara:strand:- start:687 stop:911 length:225 start_codon:yes stop_codon:yes gene_type:complete
MDIIEVTRSSLKATLEESAFELNAALAAPVDEGARLRFTKALQKYSHTVIQLDTLFKLQQQVDGATSPEPPAQE